MHHLHLHFPGNADAPSHSGIPGSVEDGLVNLLVVLDLPELRDSDGVRLCPSFADFAFPDRDGLPLRVPRLIDGLRDVGVDGASPHVAERNSLRVGIGNHGQRVWDALMDDPGGSIVVFEDNAPRAESSEHLILDRCRLRRLRPLVCLMARIMEARAPPSPQAPRYPRGRYFDRVSLRGDGVQQLDGLQACRCCR